MNCLICNKELTNRNKSGYCKNHLTLSPKYKNYYKNNKEKYKEYSKKRLIENMTEEQKENRKLSVNKYNHSNKRKNTLNKYNHSNKRKEYNKIWQKEKRNNNISYRLRGSIAANIRNKFKNKSTDEYINISLLKEHLENQFNEHMNWDNYGTYWEIDHIIPQSLFDFTNEEEVLICWNIRNLRPLSKIENIKKSNSLDYELIEKYQIKDLLDIIF